MKQKLLLLLTILSLNVAVAQEFIANGIKYNVISPTTVEVIANDPIYSGDITTILETATDASTETTYDVTAIGDEAFYKCDALISVLVPNSVTSIGENAFYRCTAATSITIPSTVSSIGEGAFNECSALTEFDIPKSITAIEEGTFYKCLLLEKIEIPEGVTSIGAEAFSRCEVATLITIPSTVSSIGASAFDQCKKVTSIEIPDGVTEIAEGLFYKCYALESIIIPESVSSIGLEAFNQNTVLANITIPEAVTFIGESAFYKCYALESINIPANVTSIGTLAFNKTGLTNVSVGATDPANITLGATVFLDTDVSVATLTAPDDISASAYEAAPQWLEFGSIVSGTLGTDDVVLAASFGVYPNPVQNTLFIKHNSDQELKSVSVYNVQGKLVLNSTNSTIDVSHLVKGVYLVKITTSLGSATKKLVKI